LNKKIDYVNSDKDDDNDISMTTMNQNEHINDRFIEDRIKQEQYDAELALQLQRQFDNEENNNNDNVNNEYNDNNNHVDYNNSNGHDTNNGQNNDNYNNHNNFANYINDDNYNDHNNNYNNHNNNNNNNNHNYYNHYNLNNYNSHRQNSHQQNQSYHSQQPQMMSQSFSYSFRNNGNSHIATITKTVNGSTIQRTIINTNNNDHNHNHNYNHNNNLNYNGNNIHTHNNHNNHNNNNNMYDNFFSSSSFPPIANQNFHNNISRFNEMPHDIPNRQRSFSRFNSNHHENYNNRNVNNNNYYNNIPSSFFQFPTFSFINFNNFDEFASYSSDSSNGANEEQIQALPEDYYRCDKNDNSKSTKNESQTCSICLEEFCDQDTIKRLPCLHVFHSHEIDSWLRISSGCPICRMPIGQ